MTASKVVRISLKPDFDFEPARESAMSARRALTCLLRVFTAASRAAREGPSATSRGLPCVSWREV